MLPSIRRVSSTNASGSKPRSNTKNDRIPQPSIRSKKNKVESHHKKFKSSANKNNHVSDCNANVKNVALSKNSDTICLSCNECFFSANHDACAIQYFKKMQKHKVAKSAKQKVKSEWKPTGRIFKIIAVAPGHILTTTVIPVEVPCPKLSLRYANAPGSLSKCMLNTECHPFNLHDFGFEGIIQDEELPPWKFDYLGIVEIVLCYYGYGDLQMGNILISRVYYVEGLDHNLFSVGQFCDSDLEVAFRKHTCFIRNLEGVDLLSGTRGSNLYTISMADMMKSSPICLLSKASKTKSWLWHRRLSHLNFGTINQLAKQGLVKGLPKLKYTKIICVRHIKWEKARRNPIHTIRNQVQMLHMALCGPMRFFRNKDEAPEIIIKFLKQDQVSLNAIVKYLRTDNNTEFLNQTLPNYTKDVGITHHTSMVRTPQQNGVVERRNRTLVEAIRTMLIFSKSSLFLWAEAVATACYTQNRSLIHTRYNKTLYELLRDCKPELKYLYVFGALCYPTNDFDDIRKLQPKLDIGIFIGYSPSKKAYHIYNKRTRQTMLTMNVQFDELTQMAYEQLGSGPDLQGLISGYISSGLVLNQAGSTSAKPPTKIDWDLLFQPMFDEYFKPPSVVSTLISAATLLPPDTARASSSSTSIDKDSPSLSNSPNIKATNSPLNSINVEPNEEVAEFDSDTFTNPFAPPDTSSA
ncbi:retrovirus-related pol polyprotein from transposon TNT 1-94 [Tanacetum coccineum]